MVSDGIGRDIDNSSTNTVARIKFCAPHFFRVHQKKHGTGSTLYDGYCSPGYCMSGNI